MLKLPDALLNLFHSVAGRCKNF